MKRLMVAACAALAFGATFAAAARAQDTNYPTRPVKLLIAFPVGGLLDTVSRIVGDKMGTLLGQQFLVEARPGAGGTIATAALAKAAPDGYTLMMVNDNHAINPSVFKNIPYDSIKDFAPIGFVGSAPLVFAAHAGSGFKSIKDLVQAAKDKNGSLTYGSVGLGSLPHLTTELFTNAAGVKMQHVPYRGGAPALNDLVAGHISTMMTSAVVSKAHIEAGRFTALAVVSKQRLDVLPNVPTMAEVGYPVEAAYWFGLMAPAGTPPAVIAKLEKALADTLAMPDVRKRLADLGAVITPLDAKAFGAYMRSEAVKWADVVKKAGLKFD
jgi:tripartite-type tricarboxylate transporter receptor subunit TctC